MSDKKAILNVQHKYINTNVETILSVPYKSENVTPMKYYNVKLDDPTSPSEDSIQPEGGES